MVSMAVKKEGVAKEPPPIGPPLPKTAMAGALDKARKQGTKKAHKDVGKVRHIAQPYMPDWVETETDRQLVEQLKGVGAAFEQASKADVIAGIGSSTKDDEDLLLNALAHNEPFGSTGHVKTEGTVESLDGMEVARRVDHQFLGQYERKYSLPRTWMPDSWVNHEGKTLTRQRYEEEGVTGGYYTNTRTEGIVREYAMVGSPCRVYREMVFPSEPEVLKMVVWVGATHLEDPKAWKEARARAVAATKKSERSRRRNGRPKYTKYKHNWRGVYRPPPSVLWFVKHTDGASRLSMSKLYPEYDGVYPSGIIEHPESEGGRLLNSCQSMKEEVYADYLRGVVGEHVDLATFDPSLLTEEEYSELMDRLTEVDHYIDEELEANIPWSPAVAEDPSPINSADYSAEGDVTPAAPVPVLEGELILAAEYKPARRNPDQASMNARDGYVVTVDPAGSASFVPEAASQGSKGMVPIDATRLGGRGKNSQTAANDYVVDNGVSLTEGRDPSHGRLSQPQTIAYDLNDPATIGLLKADIESLHGVLDSLVYTRMVLDAKFGVDYRHEIYGDVMSNNDLHSQEYVMDAIDGYARVIDYYIACDAFDGRSMALAEKLKRDGLIAGYKSAAHFLEDSFVPWDDEYLEDQPDSKDYVDFSSEVPANSYIRDEYAQAYYKQVASETSGASTVNPDVVLDLMVSYDANDFRIMLSKLEGPAITVRKARRRMGSVIRQVAARKGWMTTAEAMRWLDKTERRIRQRAKRNEVRQRITELKATKSHIKSSLGKLQQVEDMSKYSAEVKVMTAKPSLRHKVGARLSAVWKRLLGSETDALLREDIEWRTDPVPSLETGGYARHLERVELRGLTPHGSISSGPSVFTKEDFKRNTSDVDNTGSPPEPEWPGNESVIERVKSFKAELDRVDESKREFEEVLRQTGLARVTEDKAAMLRVMPYLDKAVDLSYLFEKDSKDKVA